ncbi:MAG: FAD-dependent oxidoreductase [Candidatus Desulfofervidus auxilii]|nr:FAD-dependent oxidoreductase [Candidatus Desulfofervidus auxilii]
MKNVIVIGAGLGGLSVASALLKAGFKVKIFEKTSHIGGRCRSIWLGNEEFGRYPFDVGPIFSGTNIIKLIKNELKEKPNFKPEFVKIYIFSNKKFLMNMPPRHHLLKNLKKMGFSFSESIFFIYKLWKQRQFDSYSYMDSHNDIACFLTKNQLMRNILNMRAGLFHGCLPDDMPGYTFNAKDYGRPFYPSGGMQKIPDTFLNVIKKYNGQIYTNMSVDKILIENNKTVGVVVQGEFIKADFVISAISIVETVLKLCKGVSFKNEFLKLIKSYKQGLEVSMFFMIVDKNKIDVEDGNVLYAFLPESDLNKVMHQLFNGIYPNDPPFGIFFTKSGKFRPVTLLFYTPKGEKNKKRIIQAGEFLLEIANLAIPNLINAIVWRKIITSLDYPNEIGFKSCVLPVAESKNYKKVSFQLPIKNLFNVGSSVLPSGGGTVQAVKSGLECAKFIIKGNKLCS